MPYMPLDNAATQTSYFFVRFYTNPLLRFSSSAPDMPFKRSDSLFLMVPKPAVFHYCCTCSPSHRGFSAPAGRRDLPSPRLSKLNEDELLLPALCQSRLSGEPQAGLLISTDPALALARAYQQRTNHSLRPPALQRPLPAHIPHPIADTPK